MYEYIPDGDQEVRVDRVVVAQVVPWGVKRRPQAGATQVDLDMAA